MAIEAKHYAASRRHLYDDIIVCDMAQGLRDVALDTIQHDDGTPRFEFMQAANAEYAKRGGKYHAHIGAVAEALLMLIKDQNDVNAKEGTMNATATKTTTTTATKSRYNADYAKAYRERKAALRTEAEFELTNIYELDADELEFDVDFDDDTTI
jgi:hypothetical protein